MSRVSHLGLSIALAFVCFWCVIMGFLVYAGTAVSQGAGPLLGTVFFGVLVLATGFGALWNLKRALRSPPKNLGPAAETPAHPSATLALGATPDERLAPLLRKEEK
jgi:hypothetical protein